MKKLMDNRLQEAVAVVKTLLQLQIESGWQGKPVKALQTLIDYAETEIKLKVKR